MGGNKNKSEGLGRALIRQHNQQVQQSQDRSKALRQQQRILESVTEVTDIEAVIEQAEEADRIYSSSNPVPNLLINLYAHADNFLPSFFNFFFKLKRSDFYVFLNGLGFRDSDVPVSPEERLKQQREEEALHARSLKVPRRFLVELFLKFMVIL